MSTSTCQVAVRFTAGSPDIILYIDNPHLKTGLTLKQILRQRLPNDLASKRLRMIHAGRLLSDETSLFESFKLKASLLIKGGDDRDSPGAIRSKGKGKVIESDDSKRQAIYVHCSVGQELSSDELETELESAVKSEQILLDRVSSSSLLASRNSSTRETSNGSASMPTGPKGFDRLVSAGFSRRDIAGLRNTFRMQIEQTHTPDTMPDRQAMFLLEERWLDSSTPGSSGTTSAGIGGFTEDDERSALDDIFYGNLMGFLFPYFAIVLGFREEGIWTRRRQVAVLTGLIINIVFGFAKWSS